VIRLHELPDDAALVAMNEGEFPHTVTGGAKVAVVMTQSWCPDWLGMRTWLRQLEQANEPAHSDIDVYVLVYNKVPYFREFMRFKETAFGNSRIPYVRYYSDGQYLGDSNQVQTVAFLSRFNR